MTRFGRLVAVASLAATAAAKFAVPLSSTSRWIVDSNGQRVKLKGVNWSAHLETNTPEGLQYQSMDHIIDQIEQAGFNTVRLTYATDLAIHPDVTTEQSFRDGAAAGGVDEASMMDFFDSAVDKNEFLASSTRIQVLEEVVDRLWERGIMTLLDNHISTAMWCCGYDDGNGWPRNSSDYIPSASKDFPVDEWLQGLINMANWARDHPGVTALSIRNEMRPLPVLQNHGGDFWYDYVEMACSAVHAANPDVLCVSGGPLSATDLSQLKVRQLDTSGWQGKNVQEFHAYEFTITYQSGGNCDVLKGEWGFFNGFVLEQDRDYTAPLILSEWGVGQTGGPNQGVGDAEFAYLNCLVEYIRSNDADWIYWAVQGSYYVREGTLDHDESYGLLKHDFSAPRNPDFLDMISDIFETTQGPGYE